jgi:peptide/nickel transport system substrate-binding protein
MANYWDKVLNRRLTRRRALAATGSAAAAAAFLAACGGDDDSDSGGSGGSGDSGSGSSGGSGGSGGGAPAADNVVAPGTYIEELTPLQPVTGEGVMGGTLKIHFAASDPPELDPFTTSNVQNGWLAGFSSSGLLKWEDRQAYGQFDIVNDLAEGYEQPDETQIVFKLRPGVMWQDVDPVNGRPLTAADFKYTIERALEGGPDRALSETYGAIQSVDAVDDVTVRINMNRDVAMLSKLAHPQTVPTAPEIVDKWDRHPPTLIGAGPYIMSEYRPGEKFTWARNPTYWKGAPYLDGVEAFLQTDRGTRLANLRGGEVHLDEIVYSAFEPFQRSNPDHYVVRSAGNVHSGFGLNHQRISDIRVRQAISRATDVQSFIDIVWDGQARRNAGTFWWQVPYTLEDDEVEALAPYDVAEAMKLLSAANADGFTFTGVGTSGGGTGAGSTTQHLEIWRDQLRQVGIDMSIDIFDQPDYLQRVYVDKDHDAYAYASAGTHEDPDRLWFIFFYSGAGRQPINFSDPLMDEYLLAARDAATFDERVENYKSAQRLNLEDPGFLILMTPYNFTAFDPKVRNWLPSASYGSVTRNVADMWLDV